ncbi:uncharacterized protein LOC143284196 isoform X1 [Babylonia areolata]|uniref:uncharacterized protein LOC143284196 isoform X1 n=1 Tax=Babylonia areolata TaxID=304850 RepID=UPI003FD403FC
MLKRARDKAASSVAIVTLRRRVDGVAFGFLLCYLFWGGFLLQCGDVETNPGPNPPPSKDNMRQTRLASAGSSQRASLDRASGAGSTMPTPSATEPTLSDIMATIKAVSDQVGAQMETKLEEMKQELKQEVRELKEDYAALRSDLRGVREEMTKLREENEELKKTNKDLCQKLTDCDARIDDLEGRSKRNNLLFYGLPRRPNETSADCEGVVQDLLTDSLDMTDVMEFDRVHRLSSRPDSPVIACCTYYRQKVNILKAKGKLKGTNIFIGEDFSKGVRDIRRRLTPHLKKARQDGKRATMVFNHLLIDGKKFTVDNNDKLVDFK